MTHLSIQDYADKCGVTRATIHNRINSGDIYIDVKKSKEVGGNVIDVKKYPPKKAQKAGRKSVASKLKA